MLKRILVGLGDMAHARSATAKGIELGLAHDAELTGVTLFDADRLDATGPVPIGAGEAARQLRESRLEAAEEIITNEESEFLAACERAGVKHSLQCEVGDPFGALSSLARYHDLVICGLQSLFEHGVIAEPPDELARLVQEGVRPLLAVTEEDRPIRKVLIAYSGSMESAKTMKAFVNLQLWTDIALRIVTFHDQADIGDERLFAAEEYCQAHDLNPETECVPKPPRDAILPYAYDWGADLIVLGNSSKSMLLRRILGETALHVMQHSTVPLFLAQ